MQDAQSAAALRVVLGVVELMTGLVDWIYISSVMAEDGLLLQLLIQMLSLSGDVTVQLAAVECLLAVTGRRVSADTVYTVECQLAVTGRRVSADTVYTAECLLAVTGRRVSADTVYTAE